MKEEERTWDCVVDRKKNMSTQASGKFFTFRFIFCKFAFAIADGNALFWLSFFISPVLFSLVCKMCVWVFVCVWCVWGEGVS